MIASDVTLMRMLADGLSDDATAARNRVQAASVDLTLGDQILEYRRSNDAMIDPREDVAPRMFRSPLGDCGQSLDPRSFALATTAETVTIPNDHTALAVGKSSVGRLGLQVECAGLIDPGFHGQITLELFNMASAPILLLPGMPIAQLVLVRLDQPAAWPYAGKYVGQTGPTPSRFHRNWQAGTWA